MKKTILTLLVLAIISICNAQDHYWQANHHFENNMVGECELYINGELIINEYIELGVFCGDECRESRFVEDGLYYITIGGASGDTFIFRLYDHVSHSELNLTCTNDPVQFEINGFLGEDEPYPITFVTPASQPYTLDIRGYGSNAGGYYLIASPVTDPITPSAENGFLTSDYDLYYFDQNGDTEGKEWINYNPNAFNIVSKKGYLYASKTDTQLKFNGTACTDGNVPLVYSEQNGDHNMWGWNLIGNPLAQDASINRACYVMNSDRTDLTAVDAGTSIPAMNGVFVKATAAGQSVTFGNSSSEGGKISINVRKDRAAVIDRAIVRLDGNSTLPKFMLDSNNTKIYIPQNGSQFALVTSGSENSLPVNFKARENGTYTFSIDIDEVRMEYLHLFDNKTGADIDLLVQPDYQFNATTTDYEARFTLVFRAMTGIEENEQQSFCFMNGRSLYFCEDVEGATLSLVDMTGRMVRHETLKANGVNLSDLSEGIYVVRLAKDNEVKVQKVVVR